MNLAQKIFIACGCIAALGACKKNSPKPNDYISFYVNDAYKIIKPEADIFDDGTLMIDAGPSMKGEISLFLDTTVQLKTYHFENEKDNALGNYYDNSGISFWSDTGTLVVSAFDGKHISGSFSFKGRTLYGSPATINITEGHFSADVSYLSFSPDTCTLCDSTDSFSRRSALQNRYLRHKQVVTRAIIK
jgi:Family of unknown function (DUF6252)